VCSDGLWSGIEDELLLPLTDRERPLEASLETLAEQAVVNNAPHSDNTSAAALRLNGAKP
jgi:serine/threonine protein phosphatase PrpC